jgi:hypothetical protein
MIRNDKPVPRATQKAVFHEAASACPFCGDTTLAALQIHHVHPRATGGPNHRSNLILCCASCHDKIEASVIPLSEVLRLKVSLAAGRPSPKRRSHERVTPAASNVVQFRGVNEGVVANQVRITAPRRPRLQPPPGVIAADGDSRTYAKYLIDRYQKFKQAEVKGAMRHALFYQTIKREFGCTWEFVPLTRFDDFVTYLSDRIDGTRLGRTRRAHGQRNYSTLSEYLAGKRYGEDA